MQAKEAGEMAVAGRRIRPPAIDMGFSGVNAFFHPIASHQARAPESNWHNMRLLEIDLGDFWKRLSQ